MRWAYLVLLLLSLSFVFTFAAYSQTRPVSALTFPICEQYAELRTSEQGAACNALMQELDPQASPMLPSIQLQQSYVEIAEGFAVAAALLTFLGLSRASPRREIALGGRLRSISLAVFVGGASAFWVLAALDLLGEEYAWWHNITQTTFLPTIVLGETAFLSMVVAVASLTLYRSSEGLWVSFSAAMTRFAAPAVLLLEVGLVLVRPEFPPSEMVRQAAQFTKPLTVGGVYLVSNWLVMTVASCLLVYGLAYEGEILSSPARAPGRHNPAT
ncbi:MAG: hypothetical protein ABSB56_08430 [Nitrososphaerales archaeon]|jgi:hypothetical protein